MNTLGYILVFSILGGVISLIGGALLLSNKRVAKSLATYATPFAGGALLAAVFFDLLPEAIMSEITGAYAMVSALAGIVLFFLAEGFLRWFHHHHTHDEAHDDKKDPKIWLIIFGDTLHNALDGVAIAASFMVSIPVGVVTTIAVAAHEIPQEIGDFGLLLSKGMRRRDVLLVNLMSALATVAAALLTYLIGSEGKVPVGVLLGLSAGFLLYIALSDVIPSIHEHNHDKKAKKLAFAVQACLLILGVVTVGLANKIAHTYIDTGHNHASETHAEEFEDCVRYYDATGEKLLAIDCPGDNQDLDAFPAEEDAGHDHAEQDHAH